MAENIKIGISVDDGGSTKARIKDAENLKKVYQDVNAAAKVSAGAKTLSAGKMASQTTSENVEYGVARSAVGTGASSRDFAKQAQGLGGLVHIYATFAANVFAVGAAFRALSEAENTANMVKGLDQLGAASGRNLGTLSKDLVKATDGAISLRDAMSAVALSSSGGMSNKQILQMGDVAKKASQALGISMPDAISRLSRGITKLEPELLDELGILVRVDTAYQKYALSVGKTATSLSEYEKHQAFANAVLEQGVKKFSNVEIDSNPYDKLLASMTNLFTTGLNLLNTVLGPIAKLLAESPMALAGVFTYIGVVLISKAIPALGAWRENLRKSAEDSAAYAKNIRDVFQQYSIDKDLAELDKKIAPLQQSINSKIASAQTTLAQTLSSKSKILQKAMSGNVDAESLEKDVTKEIARRQSQVTAAKQLMITNKQASESEIAANTKIIAQEEQKIAKLKLAQTELKAASALQTKILDEETKTFDRPVSRFSEEWQRGKLAQRAEQKSISKNILAQAGDDAKLKGTIPALKSLFDNITKGMAQFDANGKKIDNLGGKLVGLRKFTTLAAGGFIILGEAIGTALSVIAPYIAILAVFGEVVSLIIDSLSTAKKEQEDFNSKIEDNANAIKSATDTYDLYMHKKKEAFSVDKVSAFSQSLTGISDALDDQILALDKWEAKASKTERFIDSIKGLSFIPFTDSNINKLTKNTVDDVEKITDLIKDSSKNIQYREKLAEVLHIDPKDVGNAKLLKESFEGLTDNEKLRLAKELNKTVQEISKDSNYSANAVKAFSESLGEIGKISDQIAQSNAFTDLQGKLGVELVNAANKFAQALQSPLDAMVSIAEIAKDPKILANLDKSALDTSQKAAQIVAQIKGIDTAIEKAKDKSKDSPASGQAAIRQLELQRETLKRSGEKLATDIGPKILEVMYKKADEAIDRSLKHAKDIAAISVERTRLGIAGGAGVPVAAEELKLRLREISIQEDLIRASYDQQMAVLANTDILTQLNALQTKETAKKTLEDTGATPAEKHVAESLLSAANATIDMYLAKAEIKANKMVSTGKVAELSARASIKQESVIAKARDAKLAETGAEKENAKLQERVKTAKELLAIDNEIRDITSERNQITLSGIKNSSKLLGLYNEQLASQELSLTAANLYIASEKDIANIQQKINEIRISGKADTPEGAAEIGRLRSQQYNKTLKFIQDTKVLQNDADMARLVGLQTYYDKLRSAQKDQLQGLNDSKQAEINLAETKLNYATALGTLTTTEIATEKSRIATLGLELDFNIKMFDIEEKRRKLQDDRQRLDIAEKAGANTSEARALLDAQSAALDSQTKGLMDLTNAKRIDIKTTQDMSTIYMDLNGTVKKAFDSMSDALVDFAKTGKISFKDLVNSMLSDMLRVMMSEQFKSLYAATQPTTGGWIQSALQSLGLMGANITGRSGIPSLMDRTNPATLANIDSSMLQNVISLPLMAKGGAYDNGIQAFAKGGAFTNSVVTSPTLFKFAHGTGLMGEAGPEAIMPLKRDAQGNLGVRTGQTAPQTSVVVNNYGSEKATTNETVDSKGNRRIEVTIGDIVAGEISRNNSSTQQALMSSFGSRPAVARR